MDAETDGYCYSSKNVGERTFCTLRKMSTRFRFCFFIMSPNDAPGRETPGISYFYREEESKNMKRRLSS